jgi:hypothetical protein
MKTKLMNAGVIIVLVLFTSLASSAFAVEGGLGRLISGMQIAPLAGVVPPEPGLAVLTGETYFEGSIGGATTVPIAGLLVANVDMKAGIHSRFV